ncbi:MAG: hypothetical protein V4541_15660 [Bacteroidota bacterium]
MRNKDTHNALLSSILFVINMRWSLIVVRYVASDGKTGSAIPVDGKTVDAKCNSSRREDGKSNSTIDRKTERREVQFQ